MLRTYSAWGRRAGAYIVDSLVILVPVVIVGFLIGAAVGLSSDDEDSALGSATVAGYLIGIVGPFVYFTYFHGSTGQTPAKRWLGIRVVGDSTGEPIGYGRAFGRYGITFVFGVFIIPLLLDYLWPLWDEKNQALHDKVVGSIVVKT